jgi:putative hydrolase of the HAD superfamily
LPVRYPFVLLDVGETLIGPRRSYGAVYAEVLGELGVDLPEKEFERAIRLVAAGVQSGLPPGADRFSHATADEDGFWLGFAREVLRRVTGRDPGEPFARRALERLRGRFADPAAWTVFPDVGPALFALRDAGHRLAVVSNWDSRLPALLDRLGLAASFDEIVVSALERVEKPDPRIFFRALERLGASPGEALHAGNSRELDVAGARAAGIAAVLIDRGDAPAPGALRDLRHLPGLARTSLARSAEDRGP